MKTLKLRTLLTGAGLCLLSASFAQDTTHVPGTDTTTTPKTDTTSFVSPANDNSRTVAITSASSVAPMLNGKVSNEARSEAKSEDTSGE